MNTPRPLGRATLALLATVLALGCDDTDDPLEPDAAPVEDPITVRFANPDGERLDAQDGRVPYFWGQQGGSMIQPVIVLDPAVVPVDRTVYLQITHRPHPDDPDAEPLDPLYDLAYEITLTPGDGGLTTGPINDMLGYGYLDGMRLTLDVDVDGGAFTWSRPLTLYFEE